MKGYRHLKYEDRLLLENLLNKKMKKKEIAKGLCCHPNTITNELKRGMYLHRNSDYTEEWRYSPELAYFKKNQKIIDKP